MGQRQSNKPKSLTQTNKTILKVESEKGKNRGDASRKGTVK